MTMSAGGQRRRVQARAFFVSRQKCQALPLACRALNLKTLWAGGWRLWGVALGCLIFRKR